MSMAHGCHVRSINKITHPPKWTDLVLSTVHLLLVMRFRDESKPLGGQVIMHLPVSEAAPST